MKIFPLLFLIVGYRCSVTCSQQYSRCKQPSSMSDSELINNGLELMNEFRNRGYSIPYNRYYSSYFNGRGSDRNYGYGYSYGTNGKDQCVCDCTSDNKSGNDLKPTSTDNYKQTASSGSNQYSNQNQKQPNDMTFLDDKSDDDEDDSIEREYRAMQQKMSNRQ